jgi:hypothetical protein
MRTYWLILLIFSSAASFFAQTNSTLLDSIINANPVLKNVIAQKQKYKPQIIYTQINRDANNKPSFVNHTYLLNEKNYFYCASLVKLPCSVFALEKINALNIKGLTRSTSMLTDSAAICQKRTWRDTTAANGYPSLEQHIKKMLLVSDNNSYGRVYEFLNPKYINARLSSLGYPDARIVHRFDVECVGPPNQFINPIRFVDADGQLIYQQPADTIKQAFTTPFEKVMVGRDVYNRRKKLISSKKDFTKSNYLSLKMAHTLLQTLVFNAYQPKDKKYNLSPGDWEFLMTYLGMYPRESDYPKYNPKVYFDSYKKYFIYGNTVESITEDSVRIFNIVGRAYGYIVDCAYIVNYRTKTEFMLSAVTYNNSRNSFGSGSYEYSTVGLPFFKELSLALYTLETHRKKKHLPDLTSVNFFKSQ